MYLAKTWVNKNNVTYVYMATKYPIIKQRAFFKTLTNSYICVYVQITDECRRDYEFPECLLNNVVKCAVGVLWLINLGRTRYLIF